MLVKKIAGIYALVIGFAIIGLWLMLLLSGQVPEWATEPFSISFHIAAEAIMAGLLIVSGIGLFSRKQWSVQLFRVSAGLVIYSVINSSGYYAQSGNNPMVAMFIVILVLTVFILMRLSKA